MCGPTSQLILDAMKSTLQIAPASGVRDRLSARLHTRQLDEALAQGSSPEATAPLALRARRLTGLSGRRAVANGLRRVVRDSCPGASPSRTRVSPRRSQVVAADHELTRLAETLAAPGPVAARGAAEAWILLTDGTGPLYNDGSRANLRARAADAADHLRFDPKR